MSSIPTTKVTLTEKSEFSAKLHKENTWIDLFADNFDYFSNTDNVEAITDAQDVYDDIHEVGSIGSYIMSEKRLIKEVGTDRDDDGIETEIVGPYTTYCELDGYECYDLIYSPYDDTDVEISVVLAPKHNFIQFIDDDSLFRIATIPASDVGYVKDSEDDDDYDYDPTDESEDLSIGLQVSDYPFAFIDDKGYWYLGVQIFDETWYLPSLYKMFFNPVTVDQFTDTSGDPEYTSYGTAALLDCPESYYNDEELKDWFDTSKIPNYGYYTLPTEFMEVDNWFHPTGLYPECGLIYNEQMLSYTEDYYNDNSTSFRSYGAIVNGHIQERDGFIYYCLASTHVDLDYVKDEEGEPEYTVTKQDRVTKDISFLIKLESETVEDEESNSYDKWGLDDIYFFDVLSDGSMLFVSGEDHYQYWSLSADGGTQTLIKEGVFYGVPVHYHAICRVGDVIFYIYIASTDVPSVSTEVDEDDYIVTWELRGISVDTGEDIGFSKLFYTANREYQASLADNDDETIMGRVPPVIVSDKDGYAYLSILNQVYKISQKGNIIWKITALYCIATVEVDDYGDIYIYVYEAESHDRRILRTCNDGYSDTNVSIFDEGLYKVRPIEVDGEYTFDVLWSWDDNDVIDTDYDDDVSVDSTAWFYLPRMILQKTKT